MFTVLRRSLILHRPITHSTNNIYRTSSTSLLSHALPELEIMEAVPLDTSHDTDLMLPKAVLKHLPEDTSFRFSFVYVDAALNIDRPFNFHRPVTESWHQFVKRVSGNVEKEIEKKTKRKNKAQRGNVEKDIEKDIEKKTKRKNKAQRGAPDKAIDSKASSTDSKAPSVDAGAPSEHSKATAANENSAAVEQSSSSNATVPADSERTTAVNVDSPALNGFIRIDLPVSHVADEDQSPREIDPEEACLPLLAHTGAKFVVGHCCYTIDRNPPSVHNIRLPKCLMQGFPVYPHKLEVEFCDKDSVRLDWYRSKSVSEGDRKSPNKRQLSESELNWDHAGEGLCYTPTIEDMNHWLKIQCTPISESSDNSEPRIGEPRSCISDTVVEAGPGMCLCDFRHIFTTEQTTPDSFRVVSYNILADLYADSDFSRNNLFPYCPPYALEIDYRKQLILRELIRYQSDIVMLQEVDSKVFSHDLEPVLGTVGMKGIFEKKGGQVSEGVACFYRTIKFRVVSSQSFILATELQSNPLFADLWTRISVNEHLAKRITDRTTAVMVVVLESLNHPNERLVVGNTHLYFAPDADHIRVLQASLFLNLIEQVHRLSAAECPSARHSVVITGDFNSTPEFGVPRLMLTQFIPEDYPEFTAHETEKLTGISLSHGFQLQSAAGMPDYTNFTVGFSGCLDYVFYDTTALQVKQVIPFPSIEELTQHTALPNVTHPSDHIAVVADLQWT